MCSEENLNSKIQRLEQKHLMFQEQWNLILKKIQFLTCEKIKASEKNTEFSLEEDIEKYNKQLEETDQNLKKVEQERDDLKQKRKELQKHETIQPNHTEYEINRDVEILYYALLDLDFQKQVELFLKSTEVPVGAWIIHGEENYGQRWLLNRLMHLIQKKTPAKVIKIGLNHKSYSNKIETTWRELSQQLDCPSFTRKPPKDEIIRAVYKCLQTQSVIFIFHKVHTMQTDLQSGWIHELMNNFWKKLVDSYKKYQSSHKLLMFLVDEGGCVEREWKHLPIELIDSSTDLFQNYWKPHLPIKLPKIEKISCPVLTDWKKTRINGLSLSLFNLDESGIQSFLDKCYGGLPQLVLEAICEECNHDWYDTEEIWLKY